MIGSTLTRVGQILDQAGVPWMVVGSVAATLHGLSRSTVDLDIVIEVDDAGVRRLVTVFEAAGFYVSEFAALDAVRRRSLFNVIDMGSGWKADLIVRKARPFSKLELDRRRRATLLGADAWVATAEDVVLSKLEWARASESERQLRDVASIVAAQGEALDHAYIDSWAPELGVEALWEAVRRAGAPEPR